jgi:hypothetical protein
MMSFSDLTSRLPIFVDPLMIAAVVPAVAPPEPGIAREQWIPKTIGSQLIISGAERITVAGLPAAISSDVEKAKAAARAPFGLLN